MIIMSYTTIGITTAKGLVKWSKEHHVIEESVKSISYEIDFTPELLSF